MAQLLKFELYKLFKQKYFYILTAISVLVALASILGAKFAGKALGMATQTTAASFFSGASSITQASILITILVTIFTANDFNEMTIRHIMTRGFSRCQVYLSKFIVALIGAMFLYVVAIIGIIVECVIFGTGVGKITGAGLALLALQAVDLTVTCSIIFALTYFFKKAAAPIAIGFIAPTAMSGVMAAIDMALKLKGNICFSNLLLSAHPFATEAGALKSGKIVEFLIVAAIYLIVALEVGYILTKNREE